MPARSQAQRSYLNAHFGHAWVKRHHYDNKGKLPARSSAPRRKDRQQMIAKFVKRNRRG